MANEFRLNMVTDNAAFTDNRNLEVAQILRDVAELLEHDVSGGTLRDVNGNRVGSYGFWIDGTLP